MKRRRRESPALLLGVALSTGLLLSACGDVGEGAFGPEPKVQFAKGGGGKGGGPRPDPVPLILDLQGGMSAEAQDGQYGTDAPDLFEASGQPHGPGNGCDTPDAQPCFQSAFQLEAGYLGAGGLAACTVPRRMSDANRDQLLSKLDAPEIAGEPQAQSRESFDLEFDRDAGSARVRTFWYEPDNPDGRYGYFLDSNDVAETGAPDDLPWQIVFTNGELSMYGLGDKALKCPWVGTITLTLTPTS